MNRNDVDAVSAGLLKPGMTEAEKAEIAAQWELAKQIMAENRDMLAKLAKL